MVRREQKDEEKQVLEQIRNAFPDFYLDVNFGLEDSETPDFVGKDQYGKVVGLELTRWLNQEQTNSTARHDRMRVSILRTLDAPQNPHPPNISSSVIFPDWKTKFTERDAQRFRDEFYELVNLLSHKWDELRANHRTPVPSDRSFSYEAWLAHFPQFKTLGKYLVSIWLNEPDRTEPPPLRECWVSVTPDGGFYQTESALSALTKVIEEKVSRYSLDTTRAALAKKNVEDLVLLVYTDPDRFTTNTPFQRPEQMMQSPTEGLVEAARMATSRLNTLPKAFNSVSLFYSAWGALWFAQIWPDFQIFEKSS